MNQTGSQRRTERNNGGADNSAQQKPCRFFTSKTGCRAGEACPFLHTEPSSTRLASDASTQPSHPRKLQESNEAVSPGRQAVRIVPQSHVVPKPVPQLDPRDFQIGQIRRRFSSKENQDAIGTTLLRFNLAPSDPDFPYELSSLDCVLSVPASYPSSVDGIKSLPSLKVKNPEIQVGFTLNIERGFDDLVAKNSPLSLLSLMNALDRNLEVFLSTEQAKVVKLVSNADRRHLKDAPVEVIGAQHVDVISPPPQNRKVDAASYIRPWTAGEKRDASGQRTVQVKQLESRLGRHKLFRKSSDGIAFTVPMEPRLRNRLPPALKSISTVTIFVPILYPLEPCRAKFEGLSVDDVKPAEVRFEERARELSDLTLMAHLNYLSQNLHSLAIPFPKEEKSTVIQAVQTSSSANTIKANVETLVSDEDRNHVIRIPRPPEWDLSDSSDFSEDSDDDSISSEHFKDFEDGGVELEPEPQTSAIPVERGTAISFPHIELFGIELFEISILNITVKCERCKEQNEASGLQDGASKSFVCKKCATSLSITFRKTMVHTNSVRAGFLDFEGCSVNDMLASTFIPTCSKCSTPWPLGIVSVRGETTTNVCRESHCHQKFVFKIPEVKFLRITSATYQPVAGSRRKKEALGLVPGQELPKRGACQHYRKSYRWFRFSCCLKIYACDRCHDEIEEHSNEHANRMICGFCSREMNYRPEDCAICHSVLVGRKGHGFWEGGKGTRDRVKMSRKDPRKYKRPGGASK